MMRIPPSSTQAATKTWLPPVVTLEGPRPVLTPLLRPVPNPRVADLNAPRRRSPVPNPRVADLNAPRRESPVPNPRVADLNAPRPSGRPGSPAEPRLENRPLEDPARVHDARLKELHDVPLGRVPPRRAPPPSTSPTSREVRKKFDNKLKSMRNFPR